jgi:hypothetical protein
MGSQSGIKLTPAIATCLNGGMSVLPDDKISQLLALAILKDRCDDATCGLTDVEVRDLLLLEQRWAAHSIQ